MKPVILAFVLLLGVMLGYAWMNSRYSSIRTLYFSPQITLGVGKTGVVNLMVNDYLKPVSEFRADFVYDPAILIIEKVEINGEIFDKLTENSVDQFAGKVTIEARSSQLVANLKKGEQKLATITMRGLKRGETSFKGGVREFGMTVK